MGKYYHVLATSIVSKKRTFSGLPSFRDKEAQFEGNLSYFHAAVASIARHQPHRIYKGEKTTGTIIENTDDPQIWAVNLLLLGVKRKFLVDLKFPPSRTFKNNILWPHLIEKAYVMAFDDFPSCWNTFDEYGSSPLCHGKSFEVFSILMVHRKWIIEGKNYKPPCSMSFTKTVNGKEEKTDPNKDKPKFSLEKFKKDLGKLLQQYAGHMLVTNAKGRAYTLVEFTDQEVTVFECSQKGGVPAGGEAFQKDGVTLHKYNVAAFADAFEDVSVALHEDWHKFDPYTLDMSKKAAGEPDHKGSNSVKQLDTIALKFSPKSIGKCNVKIVVHRVYRRFSSTDRKWYKMLVPVYMCMKNDQGVNDWATAALNDSSQFHSPATNLTENFTMRFRVSPPSKDGNFRITKGLKRIVNGKVETNEEKDLSAEDMADEKILRVVVYVREGKSNLNLKKETGHEKIPEQEFIREFMADYEKDPIKGMNKMMGQMGMGDFGMRRRLADAEAEADHDAAEELVMP